MTQRVFRISTGRYGGELAVGRVSADFVDYWRERVEEDGDSDLIEHIQGVEFDDEDMRDPDSPEISEQFNGWFEVDDKEHLNGPYADNSYYAQEVELHPDAVIEYGAVCWKDGVDHDYSVSKFEEVGEEPEAQDYENYLYSRECYSTDPDSEHLGDDVELEPVLFFHSAEKGGFGEVFVVTDGADFDPDLFAIGACETDLGTIIDSYWYDGRQLEPDFDYADSTGKGYYATVGYMNPKWHDSLDQYAADSDNVKELLEELADSVAWVKEQRENETVPA